MGIGILLKDLIIKCDTNVSEVSRVTGVPATTIYSMINRDSKNANISDLYKIAHHLGVTLDYFYDGSEDNDDIILLTKSEKDLNDKFKSLSKKKQDQLLTYLSFLSHTED